jgi:integrase
VSVGQNSESLRARDTLRRIRENLSDGEYLFPRAKVMTFDNAIARACRKAAKLADIKYGQANGFTCHSFRHTFATDLMEKTGNDAGTVMRYTGHKTIESFSIYLKPTDRGRILATQAMDGVVLTVDGFLTGSNVNGVNEGQQVSSSTKRIVSKKRGVVVS